MSTTAATARFIADLDSSVYILRIIGACAMSLGCTLASSFISLLKKKYTSAGLMDDAKNQMKKALFGPDGYWNGIPYEFGSLGLIDTM